MVDVLNINDVIDIPVGELSFNAVRSSGAGGQNVNKVATAIHLRFDSAASPALPDYVKERLVALGDRRITPNGVVIIKAQEHRTQERNRQAAMDRLRELILTVLVEKKPRKPTKPSKRSLQKRIDGKRRRGDLKQSRSNIPDD
jgi:ribosome-associated protein